MLKQKRKVSVQVLARCGCSSHEGDHETPLCGSLGCRESQRSAQQVVVLQ